MGQHIYVYSPSGAVRDKAAFRRGVARLKALGHQVELDPSVLASHMRFAGDDTTRIAAISRAAASGADVALISRGGYGLTRLLPQLPYRQLASAINKGTRFIGCSDFTALQLALFAKTGAPSWAGPVVGEDFGREDEADEVMLGCFGDMVAGQSEGVGWRSSRGVGAQAVQAGLAAPDLDISAAPLWGGNLSVLISLLATPWWPEVKGGILFLEDNNEHPYRLERMLTQLHHAGVLKRQKALLLGQFSPHKLVPHDRGFKLATVIERLRALLPIPVLDKLPFGHVPTKVLLPFGAPVRLLCQGSDALLLWPTDLGAPKTKTKTKTRKTGHAA